MSKDNKKFPENWFALWFDEWYMKVYQHRDESEASDFISKWQIWDNLNANDWCLDVGCGAGRFAHLLARKGINVLAIDLSKPLLKAAKKETAEDSNPFYVRADMRYLPTVSQFGLIISLFTSFGYFETDDEHSLLLKELSNRLRPNGILILDLPNILHVEQNVIEHPITERTIKKVTVREERCLQLQPKRVIKRIIIMKEKGKLEYTESVRLYSKEEVDVMLLSAGIEPVEYPWGDYSGSPYSNSSSRMIYFGARIG